jgi:hypothetical protein
MYKAVMIDVIKCSMESTGWAEQFVVCYKMCNV